MINSLVNTIDANEKLALAFLLSKAEKYSEQYPEDQTLGNMVRVLSHMSKTKTFIKRAELKDLYRRLHSRNTKFAQFFPEELQITESTPTTKTLTHDLNEGQEIDMYSSADPVLASALSSLFDNKPLKSYSEKLAVQAVKTVLSSLEAWDLSPVKINVVDGNEKFLVIQADYETPKGITSFYIPVETPNSKIIESNLFIHNFGIQDLNNFNVKSYLTKYAGLKLQLSGKGVLHTLVTATTEKRDISDVELALVKLNASRSNKMEFFSTNNIIGQKLEKTAQKDVQVPKYNDFEHLEQTFASPVGTATFKFGSLVKTAQDHIHRNLVSFGHKNPQINVIKSDDKSISYGVSLGIGTAFIVPVKISNAKIEKPEVVLCKGEIAPFSQEGINSLQETDYKVAAIVSSQANLNPERLISNITDSLAQGNQAAADDALNVLINSNDSSACKLGFQAYLQGLTKKAEVSTVSCSMILKNKTSTEPLCGHTGLPLHKVCQDKNGNCMPNYRKGMTDKYEGAFFNNYKIFG